MASLRWKRQTTRRCRWRSREIRRQVRREAGSRSVQPVQVVRFFRTGHSGR